MIQDSWSELVRGRRSVRFFLDEELSAAAVRDLVEESSWAPSGGNAQPWRVTALRPSHARVFIDRHEADVWKWTAPEFARVLRRRDPKLSRRDALDRAHEMAELGAYVRGRPWLLIVHRDEEPGSEWLKTHVVQAWRHRAELLRYVSRMPRAWRVARCVGDASLVAFMQTLCLAAEARGFGACLQWEWLSADEPLRRACRLSQRARIVGTVLLGNPDSSHPMMKRQRELASRQPVPICWI